jgi:hypothetical protein
MSWTRVIRLRIVVVSCEHCAEVLGFVNGRKFLDHLSDYKLLEDSGPWSQFMTYDNSTENEPYRYDIHSVDKLR